MSRSNSTSVLKRCKELLSKAKNSFTGKYYLYTGEKRDWVQVSLRLERSIFAAIFPWVLFCGAYGFLVSLLHAAAISCFCDRNEVTSKGRAFG